MLKKGFVIRVIKNNDKKLKKLWERVSKTYLNYFCDKTYSNVEAFKKAYKNYKKAGGIKTILSGEKLINIST